MRTPAHCSRAGLRSAAGYTLMELMLVLTLMGVLMGFGIGAFVSLGKRTAYEQTLASTTGLVNKVKNASSRFPAALVTDPAERRIYGRTEQILQELHFEPRRGDGEALDDFAKGIGGLDVDVIGGDLLPEGGRVGGGLKVTGGGVDCGNYAAYDVEDGISIELWIQPETVGMAQLVEKGDAFNVAILPSSSGPGRIRVRMSVRDMGDREEISHEAEIPRVRAGKWMGIIVGYDRSEITVRTDDGFGPVLRGSFPETRPLYTDPDASLRVATDFVGVIDDFRFGGVRVEDPVLLPAGVYLAGNATTLHFSSGKLDPRKHPGVVRIFLGSKEEKAVIEIGQNGTVQRVARPKEGEWPTDDGSTLQPPGTDVETTPEKDE